MAINLAMIDILHLVEMDRPPRHVEGRIVLAVGRGEGLVEGRTGSSPLSIICRALTGRKRSEMPALLCPLTCVITARLPKSSTRPATSTLLISARKGVV